MYRAPCLFKAIQAGRALFTWPSVTKHIMSGGGFESVYAFVNLFILDPFHRVAIYNIQLLC